MTSRLAIDGGDPVRTAPFPSWPVFDEREERHLLEVLHSGKWGEITGDKVTTFAARFAEYQGAKYGICVPNGTMAIQLGLKALGVGPGDEVITTPYTFVATASAALLLGAKPVFVDVRPDTCNLDPERLEAAITPKTKVIIPVHIGGQPADLDEVMRVAKKHGLRVLEDACQAWGAEWSGTRVGAIGDLGCFSFQAGKNINAGEGRNRGDERSGAGRALLVVAQRGPGARRRVVSARDSGLELPDDRMAGRGAAGAARPAAGAGTDPGALGPLSRPGAGDD